MTNPKVVAQQEWQIFQAICPEKLMDMMKQSELTSSEFVHIMTGIRALGFFDLAMYFMGHKRDSVKESTKRLSNIFKSDPLELPAYKMREKGYGKDFARQFIANIENEKLRQDFSKRAAEFYNR